MRPTDDLPIARGLPAGEATTLLPTPVDGGRAGSAPALIARPAAARAKRSLRAGASVEQLRDRHGPASGSKIGAEPG
ncbi:hypothetical protein KZ813_11425 [Sphingomonas sp. RHCKR7]|uniref:hypothetical protein n=1 Tax=Sphingomonas folli TaxID=2862497 RepID=UPI001CA5A5D8|nr:hypothetical protein [Sphingomonas folli]MBW6527452.1 hypothetical protein [Sphingomonas folli]